MSGTNLDQIILEGLDAAKPAPTAGAAGRLYFATDTGKVYRDNGSAWVERANDLQLGTTATTAAAGNDSRLSDARTPTAHATSHQSGGSDALTPADIGALPATDPSVTNARTPTAHHATHEVGGSDALTGIVPGSAFAPTGLTGATAASRYVGATASGAPASGTFALGDFVIDQSGKAWICTTAGSPGTWTQLAGGGSTTLAGDTDVAITSPTNAQVLTYNSTSGKWENQNAAGGFADPTTTKGDLIVHGTTTTRLPVGSDGQSLLADSSQTLGVRWGTATGGGSGLTNPMTAAGDLIVGQAGLVNEALVTRGAYATGKDTYTPTGYPGNTIDGNDATAWGSISNLTTAPWLQVDLGATKQITRVRLLQGTGSNAATQWKLQSSTDASTWTDRYTSASGLTGGDSGPIDITAASARYWRVVALAGSSGAGWNINSLELYTGSATGAGAPTNLALGSNGQSLQVVNGVVAWSPRAMQTDSDYPLRALGDLITGGAAATNYATAGNGATASGSSTYASFVASNAIDGNDSTQWCSNSPVSGNWLMVDLGQSRAIASYRLSQMTGADGASAFLLQWSTDSTTWNTAVGVQGAVADTGIVTLPTVTSARYWRMLAANGGSNGWRINTLALYGADGAPQRLAVGSNGQVPVADSGSATGISWQTALKSLGAQTVGTTQATIAHGLGYTPTICLVTLTGAGQVWRSAASDGTNVYLTADAAGRTCEVYVR